jgi:putative ABC transport system permease protein
MSWINGLGYRVRELFRPSSAASDLDEELRDHLERESARHAERGAGDDARRRAILSAGHSEVARENAADDRTGHALADIIRDVQYAWRTIRRNPGFAAAVILSLGLGIGGTTAIFSVVNAVLLRPLPYPDSGQLYRARVWWGDFSATLSVADDQALAETSEGIAEVASFYYPYGANGFVIAGPDGAELLPGLFVAGGLPRLLRVSPMLGPGFSATTKDCQALIGEDLWQRRFARRSDAIGQVLPLDEKLCTVVGVMARGFHVPGEKKDEVWVRAQLNPARRRGGFFIHTLVRVRPGMSAEQVADRLTAVVSPVLKARFGVHETWRYRLKSEREVLVGDVRETLFMLLSGVGLVLLVAIFNVANLLLARGTVRTRELAVRASLGARRGRLARQLLTESALLGMLGGALGLAIAEIALSLFGNAANAVIPRMNEVRLDPAMVAFAVSLGLGAGLLAGVLPVVRLPWTGLGAWLREGGRGETGPTARLRGALVVVEIALTLMVLTGSALLVKSLVRAQRQDPGFRAEGLLTFLINLPDEPYGKPQRAFEFLNALQTRIAALPGVAGVSGSSSLPPNLLTFSNNYIPEGTLPDTAGKGDVADWNIVTTSYFDTLKIGIVQGRGFDDHDVSSSPTVAVVNEAFVRRHYPDGRVLGKRFKTGDWDTAQPWTTIVGVVRDVPYESGLWGGTQPMIYSAYLQSASYQSPYIAVRSAGDPARVVPAIRRMLREMDPRLPLQDVATMDELLYRSTMVPRLRGSLFAVLGMFALALAATGIYGVMAYHVSRGRRDTAIRRALGAGRGQVLGATLVMGLRIVAVGVLIGCVAALATARSLASMLYQVDPRDPAVIASATAVVIVTAFAACLVPAIRAAQVDPATLLRDE